MEISSAIAVLMDCGWHFVQGGVVLGDFIYFQSIVWTVIVEGLCHVQYVFHRR